MIFHGIIMSHFGNNPLPRNHITQCDFVLSQESLSRLVLFRLIHSIQSRLCFVATIQESRYSNDQKSNFSIFFNPGTQSDQNSTFTIFFNPGNRNDQNSTFTIFFNPGKYERTCIKFAKGGFEPRHLTSMITTKPMITYKM